ncbi:MAG TPA: DUF4334 domain-containing protein [Pseudonocardiaceae bacterium]|nr:DUF4334 domain-containing protein [Pseudonocardiaceae bacterium]
MVTGEGAGRLAAVRGGCTRERACALFDELPVVVAEELTGRWKGSELLTGHPFDGLLTASGWYGKQFDDPETVHPLLFSCGGEIFAVDPRTLPLGLAGRVPLSVVAAGGKLINVLKPVLRTTRPRARLRDLEYRDKTSAALIYDHVPVIDVFRRVDERTLLGVMDQRGLEQPYFFVLQRE